MKKINVTIPFPSDVYQSLAAAANKAGGLTPAELLEFLALKHIARDMGGQPWGSQPGDLAGLPTPSTDREYFVEAARQIGATQNQHPRWIDGMMSEALQEAKKRLKTSPKPPIR